MRVWIPIWGLLAMCVMGIEQCPPCGGSTYACYYDGDGDGYGDPEIVECDADGICPIGYVDNGDDCDDTNEAINPDAIEVCDGVDNNCNGIEDDVTSPSYWGSAIWNFCQYQSK